jgi:cytochrome c biogenesis protein ResB
MLFYAALLVSLGCLVASTVARSGLKRWGFVLNHLGLWLVLLGAGVGSADFRELKVRIYEGEISVHATDGSGFHAGMPFGIRLDDFRMEEYQAKWGVVDISTGKFQPAGKPEFYDTEEEAFASGIEDGVHLMVASVPPEPSYFGSDITIIPAHSGQEQDAVGQERVTIEVNRPYRRGSWTVYQYGYDTAAGTGSQWSVLQLVRDPWLPVVYAGIAMLALGALTMFRTKRRKTNGVA